MLASNYALGKVLSRANCALGGSSSKGTDASAVSARIRAAARNDGR